MPLFITCLRLGVSLKWIDAKVTWRIAYFSARLHTSIVLTIFLSYFSESLSLFFPPPPQVYTYISALAWATLDDKVLEMPLGPISSLYISVVVILIATRWTDKQNRISFFRTFRISQKYVGMRDENREMHKDGFIDTKTPKDNIVRTLKAVIGRQEIAPAVKEDLNRCINILIKTENLNVVDYSAVKRVNKRGSKSGRIGEEWLGLALEARRYVVVVCHTFLLASRCGLTNNKCAPKTTGRDHRGSYSVAGGRKWFSKRLRSGSETTPGIANQCDKKMMRLFITSLNNISFNALQLRAQARMKSQNGPMFWMGWRLVLEDDLLRKCHVNDYSVFSNFLNEIDAGYEHFQAPYHNSAHGAEVMYATNYYLKESGFLKTCKITEHDLFAAVIAAAAHDFRHPGRTNAFLCKAGLEASIFDEEGPDYIE